MGINYPTGKKYQGEYASSTPKNISTYSNRGMSLEQDLNETNIYYLSKGIASIHKKPTPIQIVRVDYPKRSAAVIKEAYFKQASTTDYNGVYRGRHIDFEAKETNNKTSFPLQNFHEHQIQHMEQVLAHGGIIFVIIKFTQLNEVYLLEGIHLFHFWKRYKSGGRKSISKEEINQYAHFVTTKFHPRLDFLKIIDTLYFD